MLKGKQLEVFQTRSFGNVLVCRPKFCELGVGMESKLGCLISYVLRSCVTFRSVSSNGSSLEGFNIKVFWTMRSGVVFGWTWKVLWSLTRLFLANFCNLEMSGTLRCSERRIWLLIFFHPWNILLISTRVGVFKQFQRLFPTTG